MRPLDSHAPQQSPDLKAKAPTRPQCALGLILENISLDIEARPGRSDSVALKTRRIAVVAPSDSGSPTAAEEYLQAVLLYTSPRTSGS